MNEACKGNDHPGISRADFLRLGGAALLGATEMTPFSSTKGDTPADHADKPANVWMMPPSYQNGRCMRDLFKSPAQWAETRKLIQGIGYADHCFATQFSESELKSIFTLINRWGLALGLEVGAVKPWGVTGEATFKAENPMWKRFQSLGAKIAAIGMDEPFCAVRSAIHKSDEYAVNETANFITFVREGYPDLMVGDIEPYPYFSAQELTNWIDSLQGKLSAMQTKGMDFFRLDVDWVAFSLAGKGSWQDVKAIENHCRRQGLKFSLIYWASDFPQLQRLGIANDATWYVSVMQQAYDYALVGGKPDQYMVESWVDGPEKMTPDSGDFTFTRSVRDISRMIARKIS
jgi:hypothetical protein